MAKLAEESGAAVAVVRHLNQATGQNPLYRGGGSIGIIGQARSALLVAKDPQDESRRVLAPLKSNLAKLAPSLVFGLTEAANGAVRVAWKGQTPLDANALLAAPLNEEKRRELLALRNVVEEFLGERDGSWEGPATELLDLLAGIDPAAVPDRPDQLTKRLLELARTGADFAVSRGWRGKERVLRLHQHHDLEPQNGIGGVGGVGERAGVANATNTTYTDRGPDDGVGSVLERPGGSNPSRSGNGAHQTDLDDNLLARAITIRDEEEAS